MERAHALAEQGAGTGVAVMAAVQTAGRGRQGRAWQSGPGGLWISVVVRPPPGQLLDPLAIRIGLALAQLLEERIPGLPAVQVKWPNDLLLDGRKVGGILVETRWQGDECQWVVVGVGINLRNQVPDALAVKAVAVAELVPAPDPGELAPAVRDAVVQACRGGALEAEEIAAWSARDALRDQQIAAPVEGRTAGLAANGALRVRRHDGTIREVPSGVVTVTS